MKTIICILISLLIPFCFPRQGHSQNPRPLQKKEKLWDFKTPLVRDNTPSRYPKVVNALKGLRRTSMQNVSK